MLCREGMNVRKIGREKDKKVNGNNIFHGPFHDRSEFLMRVVYKDIGDPEVYM